MSRSRLTLRVFAIWLFAWPAYAVGFQTRTIPDPGNPPIEIGIWYPSDAEAQPQRVGLETQSVAADGAVAGRNLALVVMSHGQGGIYSGHVDTALALARAGFVAAALTHTGDNYRDQSRVLAVQDRSRQLRVLTDYMLHDWPAHAQLEATRVGAFGFSAGGFTVLVAAGGVPDMSRVAPYCATHSAEFTCTLTARNHADKQTAAAIPAAAWVHDPRIRAVVVAGPGARLHVRQDRPGGRTRACAALARRTGPRAAAARLRAGGARRTGFTTRVPRGDRSRPFRLSLALRRCESAHLADDLPKRARVRPACFPRDVRRGGRAVFRCGAERPVGGKASGSYGKKDQNFCVLGRALQEPPRQQGQKSFASFLQKRRPCLFCRISKRSIESR